MAPLSMLPVGGSRWTHTSNVVSNGPWQNADNPAWESRFIASDWVFSSSLPPFLHLCPPLAHHQVIIRPLSTSAQIQTGIILSDSIRFDGFSSLKHQVADYISLKRFKEKKKIKLSLFAHSWVVPNPYYFLLQNTKMILTFSCTSLYNNSQWGPKVLSSILQAV